VKAEIDERMAKLAKLMGDQVMPLPEDATLRERCWPSSAGIRSSGCEPQTSPG
jgi:hypothetical protein